ncbi:FecCD family ABC transporter permease [Aldersonia kunmingensis]|uniref:FecCD family ABC transporter permease n=1 Tax=Aldersonia kunmingensis TaxID=408066 RepID=UPI0009FD4270|nr:iron chelate uptake ABC transporter family permease subunit [Aldersonia kunmingensis]
MVATSVGLVVLLLVLACVDISVGDFVIPVDQVIDVLAGGGTKAQHFIVTELRMPRVATAMLVGAALGMAGAISQSILRNPLASPDMLGITSGASVAAVALIISGGGSVTGALATFGMPLASLAGALVTAAAVYVLAWRGGVEGYRLVLIGIGVNAFLIAVVSWLLLAGRIEDVAKAQIWLNGSLNETSWSRFVPVAIAFAVILVAALVSVRTLGALRFGDDTVRSLGVALQTRQGVLLLLAVVAAALATAVAGPIAFVALAAPQVGRMLLRSEGEPLIGSALIGAILVVGSDVIARTLLPVELPVGVVTAALGGPFLLYLLIRTNRKAT